MTEAQLLETDFLKIYECNFEEQKYFENKSKKVGVSGFSNCKTCPELCCLSTLCAGGLLKTLMQESTIKDKVRSQIHFARVLGPTTLRIF